MVAKENNTKSQEFPKSITVVGAGNIGSFLVPQIVHIHALQRLTIVDFDIVEEKNVFGQNFLPSNVKKHKAHVLAKLARRANPKLEVEAITERIENVPLGRLDATVIAACVDSKETRRVINQVAYRLGNPWIDAGVNARVGLFARVTPYMPDPNAPCLECAWDTNDYDTLEQIYPCLDDFPQTVPTNAPASLGALAASLQAIKCAEILSGDMDHVGFGRQVLMDASGDSLTRMDFRRNMACRFNHCTWEIKPFLRRPTETTITDILELASEFFGTEPSVFLSVEEKPFVCRVRCTNCGTSYSMLRLRGRLRSTDHTCKACRGKTVPAGFNMIDSLDLRNMEKQRIRSTLSSLGFRPGDVFSLYNGSEREIHFEIICD